MTLTDLTTLTDSKIEATYDYYTEEFTICLDLTKKYMGPEFIGRGSSAAEAVHDFVKNIRGRKVSFDFPDYPVTLDIPDTLTVD